MTLPLPGAPDDDPQRQAKFDTIATAIPGFGGRSLEIRSGTTPLTWAASIASGVVTVTHGLGRMPAQILLGMSGAGSGGFIIAMWGSKTSTTFELQSVITNSAGFTGTFDCDWLAIG